MSSLSAPDSNPHIAPEITLEGKQVLELLFWAHKTYPKGFEVAGEFVHLGQSGISGDKIWMEIWPRGTSPHLPQDPSRWTFRSRFNFDHEGALSGSHENGWVPSGRDLNPLFSHLVELRNHEAQNLGAANL